MEELALLAAVVANNPGINTEDAWKMYRELVTRVHALNSRLKTGVPAFPPESARGGPVSEDAKPAKESLTRGHTRRSLKARPQDAIKKDVIVCCICGKSMTSINARHLATHNGLTKEGYLKLCGYPADQALMSLNHLSKMKAQARKAQKAREKARGESGKTSVKPRKSGKAAATA